MSRIPTTLDVGNPMVRTRSLAKSYGLQTALDGIDLVVPEGSVYLLIGPNGAGKTTTLKILLDLVRADAGAAEVLGMDVVDDGPAVRAQIGWAAESHDVEHGWARVGELMRHHARYRPAWDEAYARRLARALDVDRRRKFGDLSKGQARRVQILLALAHRPPLLLLDEPTDGLDPVARDRVLELLSEHLAETPTTVVISTHHVHEMEKQADHVGVLSRGRIAAQLRRETLHDRLRRYEARVPEGWEEPPGLAGEVVRRRGGGREIAWTIWGEEGRVADALRSSGAEVMDVAAVTLEEAAVALLGRTPGPDAGGSEGGDR